MTEKEEQALNMDPEQSALLIYGLLRNLLFLRG
jgi:hypothetical protein